MGMGIGMG
jgi:hypothetical protein